MKITETATDTNDALRALLAFDGVDVIVQTETTNVQGWSGEIRALDDATIRNSVDAALKAYIDSQSDAIVGLRLIPIEDSAEMGMCDVTIDGSLEFTTEREPSSLPVRIVRKDASNPEFPRFEVSVIMTN